MADYKLDIFQEVLPAIDRHDYDFLSRQDADRQKGFHGPVVLRWASMLRNASQDMTDIMLMMVNSRANLDFFAIADHPDLQWRLLATCGLHMSTRHEWSNMPVRARPTSAVHAFLGAYWPEANAAEIDILIRSFTRESFEVFVRSCGLAPAEEQAAMDGYDRFHGIKVKTKKASTGGKKAKR